MTGLLSLALAAQIAAAVTAALLARRRREHRPAAVALALLAAVTPLRVALVFGVLRPARAALADPSAPFTAPLALAAVCLDGALYLAPMAIVPGLALACASPEGRRVKVAAVAGAWVLASAVLAALYPSPLVRGEGLRRFYLAADLTGLAVATAAIGWWGRLRRSPSTSHVVVILLVASDLAILLVPYSPWRTGMFSARYDGTQVIVLLLSSVLAFSQGVLWRFSPRP